MRQARDDSRQPRPSRMPQYSIAATTPTRAVLRHPKQRHPLSRHMGFRTQSAIEQRGCSSRSGGAGSLIRHFGLLSLARWRRRKTGPNASQAWERTVTRAFDYCGIRPMVKLPQSGHIFNRYRLVPWGHGAERDGVEAGKPLPRSPPKFPQNSRSGSDHNALCVLVDHLRLIRAPTGRNP